MKTKFLLLFLSMYTTTLISGVDDSIISDSSTFTNQMIDNKSVSTGVQTIEVKLEKEQGDSAGLSQFYGGLIAILAAATTVFLTNWLSEKSRKRVAREKSKEHEETAKNWLGKYFYYMEPLEKQIENLNRFLTENAELPYSLSPVSRNKSLESAFLNSQESSVVIHFINKKFQNKLSKYDCIRYVHKFESQTEVIKEVANSLIDDFSFFSLRQKELNESFNDSIENAAMILYHLEEDQIANLKNENGVDLYSPLIALWNESVKEKMVKEADLFNLQVSFIHPFLQITQKIQDSKLKRSIENDMLKCNQIIGAMRSNHKRWYDLVKMRKQNFEISLKNMEDQLDEFGDLL